MEAESTPEEVIDGSSKKDRIIAAYHVDPDVDKKTAADALGVSYEYVRQIFKDINDRAPESWEKIRAGDLDRDYPPELLEAIEHRLQEVRDSNQSADLHQATDVSDALGSSRVSDSGTSGGPSGSVAAEDLMDVRDQLALLLEQAQYTDNSDAEFVAQKGIQLLDKLLESAQ